MLDWGIIRIIFAVAFVGGHLVLALYTLIRAARQVRRSIWGIKRQERSTKS